MATKVHMEALSPTMEEGQLVRWLKAEGDDVANGDVLAEIETDKATMELVARGDGILRKILLGEGGTAPIGEVIGVIATADEDISAIVGGAGSDAAAPEAAVDATPEPAPAPVASETAPEAPAGDAGERVKASPLARIDRGCSGVDAG
jgi:pyruvate dehydrogenase E2 component (dihydrolipoamide acetyltransferase)